MSSVAEIEKAIGKLSSQEFVELERWFDAERNRKWDLEIESDSASGALDFLVKEVEEDIAKGRPARRMNSATTPRFRQTFATLPRDSAAHAQSLSALAGEPCASFTPFQKNRQKSGVREWMIILLAELQSH